MPAAPSARDRSRRASTGIFSARAGNAAGPPRVHVHDPLPDFWSVPKSERRSLRFEHDCHLTPPAHALLAKSLAGCIAPLLDDPASASR